MKRASYRRIRIAFATLFMLLTIACFVVGDEKFARLASLHPGPLAVQIATGFAASSVVLGFFFLIATFLFGRFYCAAICPLGVMQDVLGLLRGKRKYDKKLPNLKALRYTIAAVTLALLIGGWAILLRYLDPFSRFGGMLSGFAQLANVESPISFMPFIFGTLLPFACLTTLVIWKRRVYCAAICPIGTILGLFSKYGLWQVRIAQTCTGCGLCEETCPVGCIDGGEREVDNERCIRCMNCVACCPNGSISLSRQKKDESAPENPADPSRRIFILKGAALTFGVVSAGHILGGPIRALARSNKSVPGLVLPPGAMDSGRFMSSCTSCQLCALGCPTKVIRPSQYVLGPVHLEFDHGACHHDCTLCNEVCPSGALRRLSLEDKQWLKIGEASCDISKCRAVKENVACYLCSKICPKGAIYMIDAPNSPKNLEVPEVAAFHCIGCGACQSVCPMTPKAITVTGVEQTMMG